MGSEASSSHAPQRPLSPHLWLKHRARGAGEDGGGVVPPEEVPAAADRTRRRGAAHRQELGQDSSPRKNGLSRRFDGNLKRFR